MRQNFLKKHLIFLILIFSIFYIKIIYAAKLKILYPINNKIVFFDTIHVIGLIDKYRQLDIHCNDTIYSIAKRDFKKIVTKDGNFYLFKKNIKLVEGFNEISIIGKEINKIIFVIFNKKNEKIIFNKNYFHMNENKYYCKICHNFNDANECMKCHSEKSKSRFIHGPVATWQCFVCHDKNNYYAVKQPLSVQCLQCHQEFSDSMYNAKFAHAPAVVGYCIFCHSPHISSYKYFLWKDSNKLCSKCHEAKITGKHILKNKKYSHKKLKCINCHNSHYGESNFLFIKNIKNRKQLCKSCHEN